MPKSSNAQHPPAVYVLPEKSHLALVELREHMRLMGRLAESGAPTSEQCNVLPPLALAWMFKRMGRDVERVLKATYWSAEVQNRVR